MKKYYILSALLMLAACENQTVEFFEPIIPETKLEGIVMSIPQYVYEAEEMTRTTITPTSEGMSFAWKEGDKVGVYATSSMANFDIKSINEDATSATFDGGGFSLTSGSTYYAFYPYNGTATDKAAVPVNYLGQEQLENGSYSHLSEYDYMVATATATATDEASFNFAHLGSIMRFKITVPEPGVYKSLVVKSTDSDFVEEGNVDLTASTPMVVLEGSSDKLVLSLGENSQGISLTEDNLELTAYILTPPVDLSGKTLTVSIFNENDDEFSATVEGKNMQAGGAYAFNNIQIEEDETPYMTFTCDKSTIFYLTREIPTLEYSLNDGNWKELGTNQIYFGGEYGSLKIRGKSEYGTALSRIQYSTIKMSKGNKVYCTGDIRTLLNYENYEWDECFEGTSFYRLFNECTSLVTAPDIPFEQLYSDYVFECMFYGCTSLEKAPKLPATKLSFGCYYSMFQGCTSLKETPELPATDLESSCYMQMFLGCTSLTEAPELPAGTLAPSCYQNMFGGCTALIKAPKLPLKIAESCYKYMFSRCTSLIEAPELRAKVLKPNCYEGMFKGCTSLSEVKMMATTVSAANCLSEWLYNANPIGTITLDSAATWDTSLYIPSQWTILRANQ